MPPASPASPAAPHLGADWRRRASSFASVAAIRFVGMTLSSADSPERVTGAQVTASLFPTYGVAPEMGRVAVSEIGERKGVQELDVEILGVLKRYAPRPSTRSAAGELRSAMARCS